MIKINVFNQADFDKLLALRAATDQFFEDRSNLTFSGRNPELGKMINCGVCNRRHRFAHTCVQNYVVEAKRVRRRS